MAGEFQLDLRGRLRNFVLPASSALVPVFEGVMNGIHAVRDAGRTGNEGSIVVEIVREKQKTLDGVEAAQAPIEAFVIRDNGVGFNDENYSSFCTSDTQKKAKIGGRGVGRLTWVKAFEEVVVESVYKASALQLRKRCFTFTADGIIEMTDIEAPKKHKFTGTNVTLKKMKDNFYKQLAKGGDTIAQRMVDHFLVALRDKDARVVVDDGARHYDVTAEIMTVLKTATRSKFTIAGAKFELTHVKVTSNDTRGHRAAYLANQRQVKTELLHNELPQVGKSKLKDEEGTEFWSVTLVESPLLDEVVSPERDTFHFPDEADALELEQRGQVTMDAVRTRTVERIREHLDQYLAPLRERVVAQAENYVQKEAPQYRAILKAKRAAIEALAPDLSREKLDVELRRIRFHHEEELRERGTNLLASGTLDAKAYEDFLSEVNAAAIDDLAKYVRDRRVILNLLHQAIRLDKEGKYALEEAIHKLVLPMRTTSDDVPLDQMNLWLIDERLAFHAYLASDKTLSTVEVIDSSSTQRPDVIVFNRPMAFSEFPAPNFQSVVIVEFKRPMRGEYDETENPIAQVYGYIQEVRDGVAKQKDGRPFNLPDHIPFYCYIVCDLTKKLRKFADQYDLKPAFDNEGYFGHNGALRAYVEIISFDKLVDDAEKRNRAFFEKLGLPKP